MKLNKRLQYGLLLGLYLSRSGRAKISDIADELSLSKSLLFQVGVRMRQYGLLKSTRGPGGGYELLGNPPISEFVGVFQPLSVHHIQHLPAQEHRALRSFSQALTYEISDYFNKVTIRDLMGSLIQREVRVLSSLNKDAVNQ